MNIADKYVLTVDEASFFWEKFPDGYFRKNIFTTHLPQSRSSPKSSSFIFSRRFHLL